VCLKIAAQNGPWADPQGRGGPTAGRAGRSREGGGLLEWLVGPRAKDVIPAPDDVTPAPDDVIPVPDGVIPAPDDVIPAPDDVIPAPDDVIPAKAGIQDRIDALTPRTDPSP